MDICEGTDDFRCAEGDGRCPKLVRPVFMSGVMGDMAAEHTLGRDADWVE